MSIVEFKQDTIRGYHVCVDDQGRIERKIVGNLPEDVDADRLFTYATEQEMYKAWPELRQTESHVRSIATYDSRYANYDRKKVYPLKEDQAVRFLSGDRDNVNLLREEAVLRGLSTKEMAELIMSKLEQEDYEKLEQDELERMRFKLSTLSMKNDKLVTTPPTPQESEDA